MSYFQRVQPYDPQIDRRARVSPIGSLFAEMLTRLTGTMFGSAQDANQWTLANSGAGSAASIGSGIATVSSGTANNGYGSVKSLNHGRFMFAHPHIWRGAIRVTATTATNNTRRWGAMEYTSVPTADFGFWFELSGAGALSINYKRSGTAATSVSSGSFNGEVTSYTMDTNVHAYEIVFFVMGVWFFIDGVLIHKVTPTTTVLTADLDLHSVADTVNSASGTTSGTIEKWAGSILRVGQQSSRPYCANISTATTTIVKRGSGCLHRIIFNDPTNNSVTIYDNTAASGAVIATIDPGTTTDPFVLEYQCEFQNGLTIVTAGTPNLTVVYD